MSKISAKLIIARSKNLFLGLTFILITGATGSPAQSPSGGFAVESKESHAGNSDVSLYDGGLNFNLGLLKVGGRGASASYAPSLRIKGEWEVEKSYDDSYTPQFIMTLGYKGTYTQGFDYRDPRIGYGPGVMVFKREVDGSDGNWGSALTRLYFYRPQGGRTEFRDTATQGRRLGRSLWPGTNRGQYFISNDGSAITFISDAAVLDKPYCPNNPGCSQPYPYPSGYLRMSDGIVYRIDNGAVSWIRDANGNLTTFTYYPSGVTNYDGSVMPGQINTVTDPNGRVVQFEYDVQDGGYGLCDRIIYKGTAGATRTIRITKRQLSAALKSGETMATLDCELFPDYGDYVCPPNQEGCIETTAYCNASNPIVAAAVYFPDERHSDFKYNRYGELARVEIMTGGVIEYSYEGVNGDTGGFYNGDTLNGENTFVYRRVTERRTYREGNYLEKKEVYLADYGECTVNCGYIWNETSTVTVNVFDGQTAEKLLSAKHYFYGYPWLGLKRTGWDYAPWREGREYKSESLDANSNVLKRTETDFQQRTYVGWWNAGCSWNCPPLEASPAVDPRPVEVRSIDVPTNQVSKSRYGYDEFNNRTDVWEYDIGTGQAGSLIRYLHVDYLRGGYIDNVSWTSPHMRRLPQLQWVATDEYGNSKQSLTELEYDNYNSDANHAGLVLRSNVVGHDSANYGTARLLRGNVTKATKYTNAQAPSGPISAYTQYDMLGNPVKTIDGKGIVSTATYADNYGAPDGEARSNSAPGNLNGQSTFAFPASKLQPLGYTAYVQYDYFSGSIVNTEDINGVISKTFYNDPLDRPTQVVSSVGTVNEIQTNTIYDDVNRRTETRKDLFVLNDNKQRTEYYVDSLGRDIETRKYEGAGYVATRIEYDALGRQKRTTTPFRPLLSEQPAWSENFYDELGRLVKVRTPDNAEATTQYAGNVVTAIDPDGKKRRNISDALGRLIRVDEPNLQGDLGAVSAPAQATYYYFDVAGNLIKATQGGQNRYYLYDSTGRLIRTRLPEKSPNSALALADPLTGNTAWTSGSVYDLNDNLVTATSANNVTITYTYDNINRVLIANYSDSTPDVTYTYDAPNIAYSKTRLTSVTNGISTTDYTSFNTLGNVLTHVQTTDGQQFATSYKYDLSGNITEQTYPSGRVVKTALDDNGSIATVKSQKTLQDPLRTYASDFAYGPNGIVTSLRLGNGLFESAKYNNRAQVTELALGNSRAATNLWKVNYDYGTTENNGNIRSQTINTGSAVFAQTYLYDALNRVIEAKEMSDSVQTWKQNFGFDRFGNRTSFAQIIGTNQLPINSQTLPQIDASTNRFQAGQGYNYDANGNLTRDYEGRQYTFDGDNKQTVIHDINNQVIGQYHYDGGGKRIKRSTALETVIYVYNAASQLVAEYSTAVTQNPKLNYLTSDILSSPRVTTNQEKQVTARHDYMPFGEEISRANYGSDNVRQKFTGYERDSETGLDFAEARMYVSSYGRYLSIDPVGARIGIPQTLNRFQYCVNNPIRCVDKSGGYGIDIHLYLTMALAYAAGFNLLDSLAIGIWTQDPDDDPDKSPMPLLAVGARSSYHFTTKWQRLSLWQTFKDSAGGRGAGVDVFENLGNYLHALEDSFSHGTYGPILGQSPAGLDNFSILTTPVIPYFEGGKHSPFYRSAEQPDVASLRLDTAVSMARQVYSALLEAREIMSRGGRLGPGGLGTLTETHAPLKFEDIKEAIVKFINAPKLTDEDMQKAFMELMATISNLQQDRERAAQPSMRYG